MFEKDDRIGGLLRYGIPDFKLEKHVLDRRLEQMAAEGVRFEPGVARGPRHHGRQLRSEFDAVCLCMARASRGRWTCPAPSLRGVHFAMDFLTAAEPPRRPAIAPPTAGRCAITAKGKHVIVIGGGDTGSDCVGTSIRQGPLVGDAIGDAAEAARGLQSRNPLARSGRGSCGLPPRRRKAASAAGARSPRNSPATTASVEQLRGCEDRVGAEARKGWEMREKPGSEFTLPADLVLLAMGFVHVVHTGLVEQFGLKLDDRGNVAVHR